MLSDCRDHFMVGLRGLTASTNKLFTEYYRED